MLSRGSYATNEDHRGTPGKIPYLTNAQGFFTEASPEQCLDVSRKILLVFSRVIVAPSLKRFSGFSHENSVIDPP